MTAAQVINIGVVGLGRAFTLMLPTFVQDKRVRLIAAMDPRADARSAFRKAFNGRVYDNVQELAADVEVDVIYLASPHEYHAEQTRIAARYGKSVLVEKPMALTLDDCDDMIRVCDDAGVSLIVGHCHSFDTPYLKTREIIASGELGAVRMIHALNYTDFLYRPRRPEELDTERGGGVIFSQAAHQVDILRLLAGSPVTKVRAVLGRWDPHRSTEGAYSCMLWFEDDTFASATYNGYGHFDSDAWMNWSGELGNTKQMSVYGQARRRLQSIRSSEEEASMKNERTFGGRAFDWEMTKASIDAHQHFGPMIVSCEHGDIRPMPNAVVVYDDREKREFKLASPHVPRFEVMDELANAVCEDVAPRHDGRWGRRTLEVCLAMLTSSREDRDVRIAIT